MINDKTGSNIKGSSQEEDPEIIDKKAREELMDMAAEQLASLLRQQFIYTKKIKI